MLNDLNPAIRDALLSHAVVLGASPVGAAAARDREAFTAGILFGLLTRDLTTTLADLGETTEAELAETIVGLSKATAVVSEYNYPFPAGVELAARPVAQMLELLNERYDTREHLINTVGAIAQQNVSLGVRKVGQTAIELASSACEVCGDPVEEPKGLTLEDILAMVGVRG